MMNKYRLSSNAFERESEDEKILPKKVFFVSIEGNITEKQYLQGISKYRDELGINALVNVQVLERRDSDTNSAPAQVIELLEEYIDLRKLNEDDLIRDIPTNIINDFGEDTIKLFIKDASQIDKETRSSINTELTNYGYDLEYRKYLNKVGGDSDEFCILIDRDKQSHPETNMNDCIFHCRKNGYSCYVTNPCFEFWLLLHFSNVIEEYADMLETIKENEKVSNAHTYVSYELSKKAHHGKKILEFETTYLPRIDDAITHAKTFPSEVDELVDNIGCNIWKLIEKMREFDPKETTE